MRWSLCIGMSLMLLGCGKDSAKGSDYKLAAESSLTEQQKGEVVARIGDRLITLQEFEKRLNQQSTFARARHNSPSRKQEFLDSLVRFELLAIEAERKGYGEDPDVQLAQKQAMVRRFTSQELSKLVKMSDVTPADIEAHYNENISEFSRAEQVRAAHILLPSEARGLEVLAELNAAIEKTPKQAQSIFKEFVTKYSTDDATKARGGDLLFFGKPGVNPVKRPQSAPLVPTSVANAAYTLKEVGQIVAVPVKSSQGFHLIQKTGFRRPYKRELKDVSDKIRVRLFRQKKSEAMLNYVKELRTKAKVDVDESVLSKVKMNAPRLPMPSIAPPQLPTGKTP